MIRNIGIQELLLVALILLILFGANKLPQIIQSIIKSIKEFRIGLKESKNIKPK